jgi:hypothetical protein
VTLREPPGGLDLVVKNTGDMIRSGSFAYGQWSVIDSDGTSDRRGRFLPPAGTVARCRSGWVVHRSRWATHATEAAAAALAWVWAHTQIDRVVSLIAPEDLRSIESPRRSANARAGRRRPRGGEPVHLYATPALGAAFG